MMKKIIELKINTIEILRNSKARGDGFQTEFGSSSFRVFWIKNNNVDAFDNK